jgi:catechol 2,3-dioxygenase-like lactoylglutathione lyase family enzyme
MFWHKRIFAPGDCIPVEVVNVDAAQKWYAEKLGLNYTSKKIAECNVALGYEENDLLVGIRQVVGGERHDVPNHPPILFAKKVDAAHEFLSTQGVDVGPLQSDSGGNRFFRFRDLESNEVEVCQYS